MLCIAPLSRTPPAEGWAWAIHQHHFHNPHSEKNLYSAHNFNGLIKFGLLLNRQIRKYSIALHCRVGSLANLAMQFTAAKAASRASTRCRIGSIERIAS